MGVHQRRVVVTGASRGLGAAVSDALFACGADVWMVSRTEKDLRSVAEACQGSGRARWSVCDVSDPEAVERVASEVDREWGSLDVLINNAGVWLEGDLSGNTPEAIARLVTINLTGAILVTRAFRGMLSRGQSPQIVNVGSLAAIEPGPDWPVYAASKYGLRGFSDSIGQALEGDGIRVTLVNPGGIDTQLYVSAGYPDKIHQPWMMGPKTVVEAIMKIVGGEADSRISQVDIRVSNQF